MSGTDKPLTNRIALVTGASRGIGYATALALARAGAEIVAVARTAAGLQELDAEIIKLGSRTTLVPLDLQDLAGIAKLGTLVRERFGRLDVFVGNAGILGQIAPLVEVAPDAWNDALAVNLTANWHLLRAFDGALRKSDAGRVLFVSSGVAAMARPNWGTYSVSKVGLEILARTYAAETADTPIRVNVFTPGPIRTAMHATAVPDVDPMSLEPPENPAEKIVGLCLPSFQESGKTYNYMKRRLLSFRLPA